MAEKSEQKQKPILYSKGSNNQAILILHGFAANIEQTDILFNYFTRKGYTVARPILPGHSGKLDDLKLYGPEDWLEEARVWLGKLSEESESVYLMGTSFGSNLALRLAADGEKGAKAVIALEMPLFFNLKIWLLLNLVQPIMQLLGVDYFDKESRLYRKNNVKREGAFGFIPVRAAGEVRRFIRRHTFADLSAIRLPLFLLQAEQSDLLDNKKTIGYVCDHIKDEHRSVHCVPIDNHDLNLLDEEGKMIMLEKINNFINKIA